MALITCKLCGKVFTATGGRNCPECLRKLDDIYPIVREFIRNNPKTSMNVDDLSKELDIDIKDLQAMVDMGYLDRDVDRKALAEESGRQKLALEFEKSLNAMKAAQSNKPKGPVTYGQELYNKKRK